MSTFGLNWEGKSLNKNVVAWLYWEKGITQLSEQQKTSLKKLREYEHTLYPLKIEKKKKKEICIYNQKKKKKVYSAPL